jgi:hypothetical protein
MKAKTLKRVWTEVKEVNADFFNLRTVISPDTVDDDATRFYFMMLPNDGAMAHLTLVGIVYIPEVSYGSRITSSPQTDLVPAI